MSKNMDREGCECQSAGALPLLLVALLTVELLGVFFTMSEGFWFMTVAPILIFNVGPVLCLIIFVRYVL